MRRDDGAERCVRAGGLQGPAARPRARLASTAVTGLRAARPMPNSHGTRRACPGARARRSGWRQSEHLAATGKDGPGPFRGGVRRPHAHRSCWRSKCWMRTHRGGGGAARLRSAALRRRPRLLPRRIARHAPSNVAHRACICVWRGLRCVIAHQCAGSVLAGCATQQAAFESTAPSRHAPACIASERGGGATAQCSDGCACAGWQLASLAFVALVGAGRSGM